MDLSILQIVEETLKSIKLQGMLERTTWLWGVLCNLIISVALSSKNILHILDGGLRLCFAGGGFQILDSITSRAAENDGENHDDNSHLKFL